MLDVLRARLLQGYRTMRYPDGPSPKLPDRFTGRPILNPMKWTTDSAQRCAEVCPTGAITVTRQGDRIRPVVDIGKCIFCRACEHVCEPGAIRFSTDYRLASTQRTNLQIGNQSTPLLEKEPGALFRRSLKLRQISAGGCNACEADTNVLNTLFWDLGRFGIQFVASPRHADGILVTGPVSRNMREALLKTYDAVPSPKIVIATGACAISGGPYIDHAEGCNGVAGILPVDLFIPGCPPHPLTILDGLLRLIGKNVERDTSS